MQTLAKTDRLHSVLTELNRNCDAGEAYARETLGAWDERLA